MKKLPYGISDYKELREKDYYYVEKTNYLEKLEAKSEKILYLRPRRFGKTLFTSMMYYYYDIKSKDKFKELFKDTYIHGKPTSLKNSYYVLKFDFSGVTFKANNEEKILENFKESLYDGINTFLNHYDLSFEIDTSLDPAELLRRFLSFYESLKLEQKIYIIIDEYDNFSNVILG